MLTRIAAVLADHRLVTSVVALVVTGLLAVPLLTMAPTSSASPEPTGPAFTARDVLDERLAPEIAGSFFVVEATTGDLLEPDLLRLVHERTDDVRTTFADTTVTLTDPATGTAVEGVATIADVVDARLAADGGLAAAPDSAVRAATTAVVDEVGPVALGLSTQAERTADGVWRAPALSTLVYLDNEALGGGNGGPTIGTDDTTREEVLREVRDVLRGGEPGADVSRDEAGPLVAHAIAADTNLTSAEQGEAAGPFIGMVVLLTLLLVGLVFRSYWHVAVVGSGVSMLMVWLVGGSNLIGLEQDQILAVVVPIALVSFGVDFAFHALGRVREEREAGRGDAALRLGLAGVGSALLLALASDTAAFLSNVFSGIESIVQFGIAAALGLTSAFLLLGVAAPVVEHAIAQRVAPAPTGRRAALVRVVGSLGAAVAAMGAVLLTVFVAPAAGVAMVLGNAVLFVVLPAWWRSRPAARATAGPAAPVTDLHDGVVARRLGTAVVALARRGRVVLPVVGVVTVAALWSAVQIEAEFDVEDFFAADTDFVVGLDAVDEHVGETGGEPLDVVVVTDLEDPTAVARLATEVDDLRATTSVFAVGDDGRTLVDGGVVDVLRDAMSVPAARAAVEAGGTTLVDADGDGIPDTAAGLRAVYDTVLARGLPVDESGTQLLWAPAQLTPLLDRAADGLDAGRLTLQLPGSRGVTVIEQAIDELDPRMAALTADLDAIAAGSTATATGSPIVRQLSLEAVTRALLLSLPIAVIACLAVALVAMRSWRHAVIAIVPILLVVPWLYGLMQALGFSINLVTGTIGAISIGIGIDFAIHLVERFREEHVRHGDRDEALRATAEGTGLALVASAASSIIGFGVLSFAPMPLFASYGLLTALMVAMALAATLLVLPSLLRATARSRGEPTTRLVRVERSAAVG